MDDNKKLVLIGGGGHCKSVLDSVIRLGCFSEIVITDYAIPAGQTILGRKIVGNDEIFLELYAKGFRYAFVAMGSIESTDKRRAAFLRAERIGFSFPTIIDSSAVVADSAFIGAGVYIGKNAVVNAEAVIGDMAIINTGAIIEHDCKVGKFTHVAVGAVACGNSEIGKDVFVGAKAVIIQGVKVGMKSIIGAGSTVLGDVVPNSVVVGIVRGSDNDNMNTMGR